LKPNSVVGGTATFTFQAAVDACQAGDAVTNEGEITTSDDSERAIV
jgi:hypothetical protein